MAGLTRRAAVEVRTSLGGWADGFEVVDTDGRGVYHIRRLSDGTVLPRGFAEHELRPLTERSRKDNESPA